MVIVSSASWLMLRPCWQVSRLLTEVLGLGFLQRRGIYWTDKVLPCDAPIGEAQFHTSHQGGRREDQRSCCICWAAPAPTSSFSKWPLFPTMGWAPGPWRWLLTHFASLGVPWLGCDCSSAAQLQGSRARSAVHLPSAFPHTAFQPGILLSWDIRFF